MLWQCTWHNPNYRKETVRQIAWAPQHLRVSLTFALLLLITQGFPPFLLGSDATMFSSSIWFTWLFICTLYFATKILQRLKVFSFTYIFIFFTFLFIYSFFIFIFIRVTLVNKNQIWEGEKMLWLEGGWQVSIFWLGWL